MLNVKNLQSVLTFLVLSLLFCLYTSMVLAQDLPEHWQSTDIGDVAAAGSATYQDGVFNIKGSGADIWFSEDAFHFAYLRAKGDCEIMAYVTYVDAMASDAKACVMIRETLDPGSVFAMTVTCYGPDHGTYFQRRTVPYATPEHDNLDHGIPAPVWVKLVREGDSFTSSFSQDGSDWVSVGPADVIMLEEEVLIGLGVCAHLNDGSLCEVTFENVDVDPGDIEYSAIDDLHASVNPDGFQLSQNYPNPFNPSTSIEYHLPQADHVVLKVHDLQGKAVATLVNEHQSGGRHQVTWAGKDDKGQSVPSGIYVYTLTACNIVKSNKMLLVQ